MKYNADHLRALSDDELFEFISGLTMPEAEQLLNDWEIWAREKQLEPPQKPNPWNNWFINAGRGFGKTRAGVEWVRTQVKKGAKRGAAIAATNSDIERVMVKGESGFLANCWKGDKTKRGVKLGFPEWSPSKRTLTWANGATVQFFSAEEPERLRGPQFEFAWCDELAAWNKDIDTWDMLQFCLRLGRHPRTCITTTPKPTVLVRKLLKQETTHLTTGSTFDNAANLADTYLKAVKDQYEGTRLGKQELYAEVLMESEGALWTGRMIDEARVYRHVNLEDPTDPDIGKIFREDGTEVEFGIIVVSVDPAVTANVESDLTGIIVAGLDMNFNDPKDYEAYILEDHTFKGMPEEWAQRAIDLYNEWGANRIVYEKNQGGDLIPTLLRTIDPDIPLKGVHASSAKIARAEPVSLLYEKRRVKHVGNPQEGDSLNELETQMTTYEPMGRFKSPDRYDAMVWAITELLLKGRTPKRLSFTNKKD